MDSVCIVNSRYVSLISVEAFIQRWDIVEEEWCCQVQSLWSEWHSCVQMAQMCSSRNSFITLLSYSRDIIKSLNNSTYINFYHLSLISANVNHFSENSAYFYYIKGDSANLYQLSEDSASFYHLSEGSASFYHLSEDGVVTSSVCGNSACIVQHLTDLNLPLSKKMSF